MAQHHTYRDRIWEQEPAAEAFLRSVMEHGLRESCPARDYAEKGEFTALATARDVRAGESIGFRLWFSDTYVRTPRGWRYAFGQASTALPDER